MIMTAAVVRKPQEMRCPGKERPVEMRYKKVSRVVLVYNWQYIEPPGVMRMLIPFYIHVQKKGLAGITVSGSDHRRKGGHHVFQD